MSIGVDLGGTGSRFVAVTDEGRLVGSSSVRTPTTLTNEELVAFFEARIAAVAGGRQVLSLGVGASGPVDDEAIRNPDTLPAFTDLPLVALLTDAFRVPVVLENDAMVAAIAEYEVGAGRRARALLQVTLGTGIGTALLLDGRPWRGGDGIHPEGGHLSTAIPSPPCYCGRARCWEQSASRTALQAAAAALIGTRADDPSAIAAAVELAEAGAPEAALVFERYGAALGDGLATLLEVYRPTAVVLSGGAAGALPLFRPALLRVLDPLRPWVPVCSIEASSLDDLAGAIGAGLLGARQVGDGAVQRA